MLLPKRVLFWLKANTQDSKRNKGTQKIREKTLTAKNQNNVLFSIYIIGADLGSGGPVRVNSFHVQPCRDTTIVARWLSPTHSRK